jgi:hypothetical protein
VVAALGSSVILLQGILGAKSRGEWVLLLVLMLMIMLIARGEHEDDGDDIIILVLSARDRQKNYFNIRVKIIAIQNTGKTLE